MTRFELWRKAIETDELAPKILAYDEALRRGASAETCHQLYSEIIAVDGGREIFQKLAGGPLIRPRGNFSQ